MPGASFSQSSFLGGEWSPFAQGRFDRPDYQVGMNVCLNAFPIEEGAWTRRSGSRHMGTTLRGQAARLYPFAFAENAAHQLEFTSGRMRIYGPDMDSYTRLVLRNSDTQDVVNISSDTPAVVTTTTPADGTLSQVLFNFSDTLSQKFCPLLRNRVFTVGDLTADSFTLFDGVTGDPIDGSTLGWVNQPGVTVSHILELNTPYTGTKWQDIRIIQAETRGVVLHKEFVPRLLEAVTPPTSTQYANFDFRSAVLLDGPYLDPIPNLVATPSGGLEGLISLSIAYQSWSSVKVYNSGDVVLYSGINYTSLSDGNLNNQPDITPNWVTGPTGSPFEFASTDVGRSVRLFSEPAAYDAGTAYSQGDTVKYADAYYSALKATTGMTPDVSIDDWAVSTSAAIWTWATIVKVTTPTDVNISVAGPALLYNSPIETWQLGVYSDTTGYPTCGVYHEGRLWLAGAIGNRIDASKTNPISNTTINMAPTNSDGTVADNNGISYVFNATDVNTIFWMKSTSQGIVCGTQGGEWLIRASATDDPITPTSIQAKRVTDYGGENVEACTANLTMVFVQRHGRKLLEYFADVFSGRFSAPNLARDAGHITKNGIKELAFQKERTPTIWTRDATNALAGLSYQRDSLMTTQGPSMKAWHRHELGSGRSVVSISSGPSANGNLDALSMVTLGDGQYHVEQFMDLFDEGSLLTEAWFLDNAIVPSGGSISEDGASITLYGLWHLEGKSVAAWIGGLDAGDVTVSGGQVTIPFRDGVENLFSLDYLIDISGGDFSNSPDPFNMIISVDGADGALNALRVPAVVGFTYNSDGQMLRPVAPQEAGAANGPALGKTRRLHMAAALLVNTIGISFGTDFGHMKKAQLKTQGGREIPANKMFTGIWQDAIDDTYSFDGMICWRVTRPYPATVAATTGFVHTQDR